ncbi:MAG: hypothetical protein ACLP01_09845 [Solirubrobacteraceae bacterium]
MSAPGDYHLLEAAIEPGEIDHDDDGLPSQLITVTMTDDRCWVDPALAHITAQHARELAFELLALAAHADQITRVRRDQSR